MYQFDRRYKKTLSTSRVNFGDALKIKLSEIADGNKISIIANTPLQYWY
jgi:16S rRNA A1518/A1519 N6-dimethyltransferase RsmA/KsgA/DIM1 with predicted DNA glycosylase/AP lyase activity